MALPSRQVPEGLSPAEYYRLGIQYKSMGWTEQARDALTLAVEEAPDSDVGENAKRFLKTKIPRYPVPLLAEQKNIEGYNQMVIGNSQAAQDTFEELVRDFPDFEWPFGNLAALYLQEGRTDEAKRLIERALKINPNYVNAWLHLATAKGMEMDLEGALDCVASALKADPDDTAATAMKRVLENFKDE